MENATKAFEKHQKSGCRQEAVLKWHHHIEKTDVSGQLSKQISMDQTNNRYCLEILFTSIEYLARQVLSFRGNIEERGNFYQLVALRGNESEHLKSWIGWRQAYMLHEIQNEITKSSEL